MTPLARTNRRLVAGKGQGVREVCVALGIPILAPRIFLRHGLSSYTTIPPSTHQISLTHHQPTTDRRDDPMIRHADFRIISFLAWSLAAAAWINLIAASSRGRRSGRRLFGMAQRP